MARYSFRGGMLMTGNSLSIRKEQSKHWLRLHRYRQWDKWSPEQAKIDYLLWEAKIPNSGCDCQKEWKSLCEKYPPVFDSPEEFFRWGFDQHNRVSERINTKDDPHPQMGWDVAFELYRNPIVWEPAEEQAITPRSERLVMTIATGEHYHQVLELSGPLIEAYAKKVGADFLALTNTTQRWPMLEKFRTGHFAKQYKRTLLIDADTVVKADTPDLFEIVQPHRIGLRNDATEDIQRDSGWLVAQRKPLLNSQGVYLADYEEPVYYNSGVVVCSNHHDVWNAMTQPFPMEHCDEQFWFEHQAQRYPHQQLSWKYNNQWWEKEKFHSRKREAWINHYAGCSPPDRLRAMQLEIASLK